VLINIGDLASAGIGDCAKIVAEQNKATEQINKSFFIFYYKDKTSTV